MWRFRKSGTTLCVLSGVLLSLAFPLASLHPLAWVALVPYLSYILKKPGWLKLTISHFLGLGTFFTLTLYWIPNVLQSFGGFSALPAVLSLLALAVLLAALYLPFAVLCRLTSAKSAELTLICAPAYWVLCELIRNYSVGGGFPWALLGYSQQPFLALVQVADLGGVFLVSLLVVAGNCAVLSAIRGEWRQPGAFVGLIAMVLLYGGFRLGIWEPKSGDPFKVALVQANIRLAGNLDDYSTEYFDTLPSYYQEAWRNRADWVVFSEAQNPYFFERDYYYTSFWEREVSTYGVPLLFNSAFQPSGEGGYYNSAFLLDANGKATYRYDKIHLVPFGEFVPYRNIFSRFFRPLVQEVRTGFQPGGQVNTGDLVKPGVTFATMICFEAIFPQHARAASRNGAEILVNITNDSWYGRTAAPHQHLEQATFRSIETRKPLLRCANSGISAKIDSWGRIEKELDLQESGILYVEAAGNSHRSVYSIIGDWPHLVLALGAPLFAWLAPSRLKRRRPRRRSGRKARRARKTVRSQ